MKGNYFLLVCVGVSAVLLFGCKIGTSAQNSVNNADLNRTLSTSASGGEWEDFRLLEYPGFNPQWSDDEEAKISPSTQWLARHYSVSAHLCKAYFGFYPKTLEQMSELGLVAYSAEGEDFAVLKRFLVYHGFWAEPNTARYSDVLGLPVSLESASPEILMSYKHHLIRLSHFESLLGPNGQSIRVSEVLLPGIAECEKINSADWILNRKFFTNPFTGNPMEQTPSESPSQGDFSCKYVDDVTYEVQFYGWS